MDSVGMLWSCVVRVYRYSSSGSVCVATSLVVVIMSSSTSPSSTSQFFSSDNDPLYFDLLSAVYGRECEIAEKTGLVPLSICPPSIEFGL